MYISRWWGLVVAAAVVCTGASGARAQRVAGPAVEIGTQALGLVHISEEGGSSETDFAFPGGGLITLPTLYAAIFVTPQLALEPAVTYLHRSSGGVSSWTGAALLRLGGYFSGAQQDSPYLFGEVGVVGGGSDSHSSSNAAFGLGGGYRWLVADRRVALRLEGRVRRIETAFHETEVGGVFGVGIVLGR